MDEPRTTRIFEHKLQDFEKIFHSQWGLATSTIEVRSRHVSGFFKWISKRNVALRSVSVGHIERYLDAQKAKGWALPTLAIAAKPNIGSRFFPYVYSKAEIASLLAAAPICQVRRRCTIGSSTLSAIVLFLYGTGLRVTEALSLSDSNIDFPNGSIEICPGSLYRHRTIPIGSYVQRLLLRHLRSPERASFGTGRALSS